MILIDAVYINNSGGKILLDYLIENLEETDLNVYYLLDIRIKKSHPSIKESNVITYLKPSFVSRHFFYLKMAKKFTKVLCFGNLPPSVYLNKTVYTYFHQTLFIEIPSTVNIYTRIKIWLKTLVLQVLKRNTSIWLVQSESVKGKLAKKYRLKLSTISLLPFYPQLNVRNLIKKEKNSFSYVSNAGPHKNHENLLLAFCKFYDKYKIGVLNITIGNSHSVLIDKIELLKSQNYPIINHGFIDRIQLSNLYAKSEFLIYPSLTESFGLGIIEAIESNCKIIGADLPYMHAICEPSFVFNPLSISDIVNALEMAVFNDLKPSTKKVTDEIDSLIQILE